jgi:hypothetical protein
MPKIQKLTRELWDLRRQVTAGVARETTILNELKALNSPPIPESLSILRSSDEFGDYLFFFVFVLEFSVDTYFLVTTQTSLQMLEEELKQEKRRRMDAEATLKDIERECRDPFVVPALLDAFITISKITSQAVDISTKV